MRNIGMALLGLIILAGCADEQQLPEVTLTINISGFNIESDGFGSLKSHHDSSVFDGFMHKFAPGTLYFETSEGLKYMFSSGDSSLDGTTISVVPGMYKIHGESGPASATGSPKMSYRIEQQEVFITDSSATLDLIVKPSCSLVLVADEDSQLKEASIKDHEYMDKWGLDTCGLLLYSYFLPYDGYYLNLVKMDGSEFSKPTKDFNEGYVYKIEVLMAEDMGVNLTPYFEEGDIISW